MPKNASPAKVAATRGYGATVVLEGKNYDESWVKAQEIAKTTGATTIHAFDDTQIISVDNNRCWLRCAWYLVFDALKKNPQLISEAKEKLKLQYRTSNLKDSDIITCAKFKLSYGKIDLINEKIRSKGMIDGDSGVCA